MAFTDLDDPVLRIMQVRLARRTPVLADTGQMSFVDIDSALRRAY
jgi:hypothetical protein